MFILACIGLITLTIGWCLALVGLLMDEQRITLTGLTISLSVILVTSLVVEHTNGGITDPRPATTTERSALTC